MNPLRILIVEDYEQDLENFRDTVAIYGEEKDRDVEVVECTNLDEAMGKLDPSFDGAIIDIELSTQDDKVDEGNQLIRQIAESYFRIPIFVYTANPTRVDESIEGIDVYIKGKSEYSDLLDRFWAVYDTGLTRIMGGRGKIEELLSRIFRKNLTPRRDNWIERSKNEGQSRTERALLRYTLNHMLHLLDDDGESCFPEEVYLSPPLLDGITTGSIVKGKSDNQQFAILSPACDLVIRKNGEFKTDRLLLVKIECANGILDKATTDIKKMAEGRRKKEKLDDRLRDILNNNYTLYYHWLPKTDFFAGGFLNFRKVNALTKDEFDDKFENPSIQISPFFVKDIVARFSSF